ncbi:MAG: serine racemase VanT catalytic subunit [Lachnospiraceae bacterium]|nr:serine racemase VanT catalytic subunit [Lachnospiraceae bacterium]
MRTADRSYTGIDSFRLIAALFIIAIHTSPLKTYSELGDFMLTRGIARIAVPFFFMTSGFFLISRYNYKMDKLGVFAKKTALIYGAAIVLYIPINIYNGYFKMENLLPNIIKDIVFDGTLYHLWYLPASLAGGALAWYLVRRLGYHRALAVAAALYLTGLFGDSYYGLIEKVPAFSGFYALMFQVSDYTRNGIFFAPVFFILGGWIADCQIRLRQTTAWMMSALTMLLMLAEGLILHCFQVQRHDSMYFFLVPCMYFLFQALLHFRGKRHVWMRDVSLLIYIIHPMMIVLIRLAAKVLHMQTLLVDNSVVHFLAVVAASVSFSVAAAALRRRFGHNKRKQHKGTDRAYIEINLDNLAHNVKILREAMPPKCELMAVVKAEAYGHGMYEIAVYLDKIGVRAFAAATIDEGIALRRYGIRGEILILGYTPPGRAWELRKYDLTQTLVDYNYACRLNAQEYRVKAHIKLDTGMHRLGFGVSMDSNAGKELQNLLSVFSMRYLTINGIYTHLCVADSLDEEDILFTRRQIAGFYKVINRLKKQGICIPKIHIQSSYGLLNYPELKCSYVRAGISLYGVLSTPNTQTKLQLDLKPVLALKAYVILIRKVKQGDSVGYGRTFVSDRDSRIAIVSIGYADGYPRILSGKGHHVLVNGQQAPIVGRICMDQFAIDITGLSNISVGTTVTLIGRDNGGEITAPVAAQQAQSITNELLSRIGTRVVVKGI